MLPPTTAGAGSLRLTQWGPRTPEARVRSAYPKVIAERITPLVFDCQHTAINNSGSHHFTRTSLYFPRENFPQSIWVSLRQPNTVPFILISVCVQHLSTPNVSFRKLRNLCYIRTYGISISREALKGILHISTTCTHTFTLFICQRYLRLMGCVHNNYFGV